MNKPPENPDWKPILCLDFDGVIHNMNTTWKGADVVEDQPVPGALEFIFAATERFEVHIYSSRSNQSGGIAAMQAWLVNYIRRDYEMEREDVVLFVKQILRWPLEKPPAMVALDDRVLTFTGEWPDLQELRDFTPWNRKKRSGTK